MLHDRIVDRRRGRRLELIGIGAGAQSSPRRSGDRRPARVVNFRRVTLKFLDEGSSREQEHSGVPIGVPGTDQPFRFFHVRLLDKSLRIPDARSNFRAGGDISVARLGASRSNSEGDELAALGDRNPGSNGTEKRPRIRNELVTGHDQEHRIFLFHSKGGESHGGGGTPWEGFNDQIHAGSRFGDLIGLACSGHDQGRFEEVSVSDALQRLLEQGSGSNELQQMLRVIFRGNRP